MKNYLSSLALLLFTLLFAVIQTAAAAAPVEASAGANDDVLAEDWLDAAYEQYYPSDSPAANSLVARDAPEALESSAKKDELVDPARHRDVRIIIDNPYYRWRYPYWRRPWYYRRRYRYDW